MAGVPMRAVRRGAVLVAAGLAGAEVAVRLGAPMAWMIGPMLVAAALTVSGWSVAMPRQMRPAGQILVATAVGLQLTPGTIRAAAGLIPEMLAVALASGVFAVLAALLLGHLSGCDRATALYASIPCGPAEMAELAERGGGQGALVGLVQALRIALVVLIVPNALAIAGVEGGAAIGTLDAPFAIGALALPVLTLSLLTALVAHRLNLVSPFFLGPLTLASCVALAVDAPVVWPSALTSGGQFLLGLALGLGFDRRLLGQAPRFVLTSTAMTLLMIVACTALALTLSALGDVSPATMVLATAPGSVTEMSLTAKILGLDVALVGAFHIVRLFILMPLAPMTLRWVGPRPG